MARKSSVPRVRAAGPRAVPLPPGNVRPNPCGDLPKIDPSAFVDPTALVIGNVRIGPRTFVGPNAVLRADEPDSAGRVAPIEIGDECNVQDGVIIHALGGTSVTIGPRSSLSHGCIVHGPCDVGRGCFIGFRAVVFGARLADGVMVGTGAIVQSAEVPPNRLVPPGAAILSSGSAATLPATGPAERTFMDKVVAANLGLTAAYRGRAGEGRRQRPTATQS